MSFIANMDQIESNLRRVMELKSAILRVRLRLETMNLY